MAFAACINFLSAQTLQVVSDSDGKMGYKDAHGAIVIKCDYDFAEPFDASGLAKVGVDEKYGLIKPDGSFALPMEYSNIEDRISGLPTRVKKGKKYGLIDSQTGNIILAAEKSYVSRFNCYGLAWFTNGGKIIQAQGKQGVNGGKLGIVDKYGKELLTPKLKGVFEFSTKTHFATQKVFGESELLGIFGYWITDTLKTDCKYLGFTGTPLSTKEAGLMDINGNVLVEEDIYTWVSKPIEGIMRYWNTKSKSITYGYIDITTGKTAPERTIQQAINEADIVTHGDFYGNIAPENSTDGWYFIDKTFTVKETGFSKIKFEKGTTLDNGFYAGIAEGKSVVYRTNGTKLFTNLTFSDVSLPNINYGTSTNIAIKQGDKWGLYDINGNALLQPQYEYLTASYNGLYFFKEGGKWGTIDDKGTVLVPAKYIGIVYPQEANPTNIWVMTADSIYYNYDIKQHQALVRGFKSVGAFKDGMALANPINTSGKPEGMYTDLYILVDTQNKVLVDKPFPLACATEVKKAVLKNGGLALTSNQANKLVLKQTQGIVRYDIDTVIPEEGWDY